MSGQEFTEHQCHEVVKSKPMTRGAYNVYRWALPEDEEDEDCADEGRLIQHETGRESWTPNKDFELYYNPVLAKTAKNRLIDEQWQLKINIDKLGVFIHESEVFETLGDVSKMLMRDQLEFMRSYHATLVKRLAIL